jgi:hypothetical protein
MTLSGLAGRIAGSGEYPIFPNLARKTKSLVALEAGCRANYVIINAGNDLAIGMLYENMTETAVIEFAIGQHGAGHQPGESQGQQREFHKVLDGSLVNHL